MCIRDRFNAPFKKAVESAVMQHIQEDLEGYLHGKFTAGERRILFTKWVGQAWEELSQNRTIALRAFMKCGISVAADGSEDDEINLTGLEQYKPRKPRLLSLKKTHLTVPVTTLMLTVPLALAVSLKRAVMTKVHQTTSYHLQSYTKSVSTLILYYT